MTGIAIGDHRQRVGYGVLALLVLFVLVAPFFFVTTGYRLDISRLAIYVAMLAATWSLLAGVGGQFSFAHVAIAGLGSYASAIWVRDVSGSFGSIYGGIAFGTLFAWLTGTLLGLLLLRLRAAYLALFTIAFAEMARLVVVAEVDLTRGRLSLGVPLLPGDERAHYYLMVVVLALNLAAIYWLLSSRFGLFLHAMREDEEAASALGVNVVRLKVMVFSLTSLMIGLSASIYTHTVSRIAPERLDLLVMGQVIAVAVIGGIESPLAAGIGALIAFWILESLREIDIGTGAMDSLTIVVVIVVVLLVVSIVRARKQAGEPLPPQLRSLSGWLVAGFASAVVFLYLAGPADGLNSWLVWLILGASITAFTLFLTKAIDLGIPGWAEPVVHQMVAVCGLLALLARMITSHSLLVELGVWRFGIFGLVLMISLRFARNGLVYPILQYFSGAQGARERTVAFRDANATASEGSEPDSGVSIEEGERP